MSAQGTYSPDGKYWWDGKQWQPVTPPTPTPSSGPAPAGKKHRRRWPWVIGAVGVLVLLIVVISVSTSGSGAKSPSTATHPTAAPATAATKATAAPTTAAKPTAAPAANPFDSSYGTFAATSAQGTSDSVVTLPSGPKAGLVTATYSGDGNFVIEQLDSSNQESDLLVNTIGNYSGVTAFGFRGEAKTLKITASGAWTVKLSPISAAPTIASQAGGTGDAVYLWTGKAAKWALSNQGAGNFVVQTRDSSLFGGNLLVNEIGNYQGTVPVTQGPAVVSITSDGAWSLSVQ